MVGPPVLPGTLLSLRAGISAQIGKRISNTEITEDTEIFCRAQRLPLFFLLCVLCDLCVDISSTFLFHFSSLRLIDSVVNLHPIRATCFCTPLTVMTVYDGL